MKKFFGFSHIFWYFSHTATKKTKSGCQIEQSKGMIMEKFITGAALGVLAGALITANNYKMRTLVRKGQEEVSAKFDKIMDEKIEMLEKGAKKIKKEVEEKAEEIEQKVKSKKAAPKKENA
jgi:uncharacterized membrane protein YgaE (UPF0421/DUF939 family)